MNLQINNLCNADSPQLNQMIRKGLHDHVVKHFSLEEPNTYFELTVDKDGVDYKLSLNFQYKNIHSHLHSKNIHFEKSFQHLIKELERDIIKRSKKSINKKHEPSIYNQ